MFSRRLISFSVKPLSEVAQGILGSPSAKNLRVTQLRVTLLPAAFPKCQTRSLDVPGNLEFAQSSGARPARRQERDSEAGKLGLRWAAI